MDYIDELQESEFVTDTDDQDSLDEKIESEQRLRNHQLWASFQNAACYITELYKDRSQPNISPWVPFQNAASNLTSLYKDCIESQKRFAKLGYQIGRRKRIRDLNKMLKKHKITAKQFQTLASSDRNTISQTDSANSQPVDRSFNYQNVSSILAVNQLNIDCDDTPSNSMQQAQLSTNQFPSKHSSQHHQHQQQQQPQMQQQQQSNLQAPLPTQDDHLTTFQQALSAQPPVKGIKSGQIRRSCANVAGPQLTTRAIEHKSEEDRLLELNQFLTEEYHRHVGSRKRSCTNQGGLTIKRFRE